MFRKYLDKIIQAVTSEECSEELAAAKKEYFSSTGEVFDDDKSFESRMISFVEWYSFDRILKKYQKTPIEYFINANVQTLNDDEKAIYNGFLKNIHSVFYVKKIKKNNIIIKNLSDSKKFSIQENDSSMFFQKGDIFEARLMPFNGTYHFSGSFCFHPKELYKKIKKELKKSNDNEKEKKAFLHRLSYMSLKFERSRLISSKDIYDF